MRSRTLLCFLAALSCASTAALVLGPRPVRCAPTRSSCVSMAVKKGDTVVVLAGNDKGSTGKVIEVDRKKNKVMVEGVNVRSKHVKPMKEGETGRIIKREVAIDISNVAPAEEEAAAPAAS